MGSWKLSVQFIKLLRASHPLPRAVFSIYSTVYFDILDSRCTSVGHDLKSLPKLKMKSNEKTRYLYLHKEAMGYKEIFLVRYVSTFFLLFRDYTLHQCMGISDS